ncbi:MAG: DinB family protein [Thermoanaerobaculia bacterium]
MRRLAVVFLIILGSTTAQARILPPVAPPPRSGFRAEFLVDLTDVEKRIMALAAVVPADRFSWRPAPGVRSVSEVYMHIVGGNYLLATFVGAKSSAREEESTLEQITAKPRVLEELRKSFDHLRRAALTTTDRELDQPIRMFGNATTKRGALMMALNHLHEHLGQSIAYARMNGIVPPWSQLQ